ncbi:MAG: hypothetical protein LM571_02405 [Desulfurococcaceae archaeon]|nr:hypothetical protein [Desulfurococcaceae archaeon]
MSQKTEKTVSKEIKIVTRPVATLEDVSRDLRKVSLLEVVRNLGEVSERGLISSLYILKSEVGKDLGYQFQVVGSSVSSREVLEDVRVLLYLGLLEVSPRRKLRLTSLGKEFLEKLSGGLRERLEDIAKSVEGIKQRVLSEDSLLNLAPAGGRRGRRRR